MSLPQRINSNRLAWQKASLLVRRWPRITASAKLAALYLMEEAETLRLSIPFRLCVNVAAIGAAEGTSGTSGRRSLQALQKGGLIDVIDTKHGRWDLVFLDPAEVAKARWAPGDLQQAFDFLTEWEVHHTAADRESNEALPTVPMHPPDGAGASVPADGSVTDASRFRQFSPYPSSIDLSIPSPSNLPENVLTQDQRNTTKKREGEGARHASVTSPTHPSAEVIAIEAELQRRRAAEAQRKERELQTPQAKPVASSIAPHAGSHGVASPAFDPVHSAQNHEAQLAHFDAYQRDRLAPYGEIWPDYLRNVSRAVVNGDITTAVLDEVLNYTCRKMRDQAYQIACDVTGLAAREAKPLHQIYAGTMGRKHASLRGRKGAPRHA